MVKVFALIPRRPDVSEEFFHEHWSTIHAEHAKKITTIRRYVQSHRVPGKVAGLEGALYEGIAEVWFDDLRTAVAMGEDPNYVDNAQKDEPNFIDMANLTFLMCDERELRDTSPSGADDVVFKTMLLLRRASGTTSEQLRERLLTAGEAVASAEKVSFSISLPETYEGAQPAFDAVAEFTFAREADLQEADDDVREWVETALKSVVDTAGSSALNVRELRVVWPEPAARTA